MINIAEILKDYPKGTKLYSPIFGDVYLEKIRPHLAIIVTIDKEQGDFKEEFLYDGRYGMNGECLLYPSKENRDWGNFQKPFKDGDIIYIENYNSFKCISIFKRYSENQIYSYVDYCLNTDTYYHNHPENILTSINYIKYQRLATEEEKQKLFDVIKANDYKWNIETKTLEKLIVPKFKVGDKIKKKGDYISGIITNIDEDNFYKVEYGSGAVSYVNVESQDKYELILNKFDISTLKAFDKMLVRCMDDKWKISFYGYYNKDLNYPFVCTDGNTYDKCIPYNDETKHLLGTTGDCDEYYKTW